MTFKVIMCFFHELFIFFRPKNDEKRVCGHFNSKQTATRHTALKSDRNEPAENKQ